jgi:hypothetical protein
MSAKEKADLCFILGKTILNKNSHASVPLTVYTGENPRQHVVLKNTSQMRTMSVCLFIPLRQLLSWGWYDSVDMYIYIYMYQSLE